MKRVLLNGKALTKKDMCEHITSVFYYVPLDKFIGYIYIECKRLLRFLVLAYRPECKDDYENFF